MLNLPPAQPQVPVQGAILAHCMARVNLNRVQATALASNLINALKNDQDPTVILPTYDYGREITRILTEGLWAQPGRPCRRVGFMRQKRSV
jgi:hypothetical protein